MKDEDKKAEIAMTFKGFFTGTAFRCIIVLLVIVLVSGILLTICQTLFYVSDAERLQRAMKKIYGTEVTATAIDLSDKETEYENGTINSAYYIADYDHYLINSTGKGGYSNGTVTCYIVVEVSDNQITGIGKVVIDSNVGQSYIANISSADLGEFSDNFEDGSNYVVWGGTGATRSLTAIVNSVNTAMAFVRSELLGETIADPYEGFEYTDYINKDGTSYSVENGVVTFEILTKSSNDSTSLRPNAFTIKVTVGEGGVIADYEIVTNGTTGDYWLEKMPDNILNGSLFKGLNAEGLSALINDGVFDSESFDSSVVTGATHSNFLCTYAALFAAANYELCIERGGSGTVIPDPDPEPESDWEYTDYIDTDATTFTVDGNNVSYSIVTLKTDGLRPNAFTIKVTVGEGGVIADYEIVTNGTTGDYWLEKMPDNILNGSLFKGLNAEELSALINGGVFDSESFDSSVVTGATHSNFLCAYAALYAAANYDYCISTVPQQPEVSYTDYIDTDATTFTVDGNNVSYSIVTLKTDGLRPNAFTINVTVGEGGVISDYEIVTNGSTSNYWLEKMPDNILNGSLFKGLNAEELSALINGGVFDSESFDSSVVTGATHSNFLCAYAALFAAANYELCVGGAQ